MICKYRYFAYILSLWEHGPNFRLANGHVRALTHINFVKIFVRKYSNLAVTRMLIRTCETTFWICFDHGTKTNETNNVLLTRNYKLFTFFNHFILRTKQYHTHISMPEIHKLYYCPNLLRLWAAVLCLCCKRIARKRFQTFTVRNEDW